MSGKDSETCQLFHPGELSLRIALGAASGGVLGHANYANPGAFQHFARYAILVTRGTAALQIGASRTHDLRDLAHVSGPIDVKVSYVFACFRCDESQAIIQDLGSCSVQHLAGSGCWHSAKLLGADRHEDVSAFQTIDQLLALLGTPPMPAAWNPEQARTDQDGLDAIDSRKQAAVLRFSRSFHSKDLPQ